MNLAGLLIDPQPAPARLAQDPVGGPLGERNLADQPGFHPLGRNFCTVASRVAMLSWSRPPS
jgi:hypothetical protein